MYLSPPTTTVDSQWLMAVMTAIIELTEQPDSQSRSNVATQARGPEPKLFRKLISELTEAYPKRLWRIWRLTSAGPPYASGAGRQGRESVKIGEAGRLEHIL
jgi:hypothetical protein